MSSILIESDPIPLRADADGVVRIGLTRVTLDTLVIAFQNGATPESIAEQYPALRIDEIYSVVGYYLRHRDSVDHYLAEREAVREQVRGENETRFPPNGVRERLMARKPSPSREE